MRIVQVIPNFELGGVQKAGCVLADYLSRLGHETWVAGCEGGPRFVDHSDGVAATHMVAPLESIPDQIAPLKPDIIHVHAGMYETANMRVFLDSPALKAATKVVTPVFARPPEDRDLLKQVRTLCVGIYTHYRLLKWLGYSVEKACREGIVYAPLTPFEPPLAGVTALDPVQKVAERRERLGINPSALVIGRIGRNTASKWHPETQNIVDRLLATFDNVVWVSVGMPDEVGAKYLKQKWQDRVVNLPETSDYQYICEILSSLDMQLFTSRYGECFASSICETAGLGVPTLALSTPLNDNGQAEQAIDGTTGYLIASADDVVRRIESFQENPQSLAALKQSTFNYANEHWHAKAVAARVEKFYAHWHQGNVDAGPLSEEIIATHRTFAAGYRQRVVSLAAKGPLDYARLYSALRAVENYWTFKLGKALKKWLPF